jgi:hypothetical protein
MANRPLLSSARPRALVDAVLRTGRTRVHAFVMRRRTLFFGGLGLLLVAWTAMEAGPGSVYADDGASNGPSVSYYSFFNRWPSEPHALDGHPRFLEPRERMRCETEGLVRYRSDALRYGVLVHPAFVERLVRFERYASDLAVETYGRAPRRLVHRGAFNCREARGRRGRISEHAYGNALDLQGFDFPAVRRTDPAYRSLPPHLRRAFQVRVARHWRPRRAPDAVHARFLHTLAEGLRTRPEIFRGIVGPPRPRHADHLHLDAAPWVYAMFGYDPVVM